jgi:hypothetical protein
MKTRIQPIKNSMNRSPLRRALLLIGFLLACFGLSPLARAVNETTSNGNTAEGSGALQNVTTGSNNTALGFDALFTDTTAVENTATGFQALFRNTSGFQNAATGSEALLNNTTGFHNTADGYSALRNNTSGQHNTADGDFALFSNTLGNFNTAAGAHTLVRNTTGGLNIVLGFAAGQNLTTGSNNIDLANGGVAGESNTIRIGNEVAFTDLIGIIHPAHTKTFIAGIRGATASGGVAVFVNSSGQLGTMTSSARFKDEIKPMDKASEAILALKPVTFRYKKELDPVGIPQFGLVAEAVEKVNPDLVVRDAEGKPYTVRYEAVNAMLLNEFLKEHRKVQKLEAALAAVNERLKAQDAKIDKVNAKVEVSKPAPQVVNNNQ